MRKKIILAILMILIIIITVTTINMAMIDKKVIVINPRTWWER